jgi:hypothetical protein
VTARIMSDTGWMNWCIICYCHDIVIAMIYHTVVIVNRNVVLLRINVKISVAIYCFPLWRCVQIVKTVNLIGEMIDLPSVGCHNVTLSLVMHLNHMWERICCITFPCIVVKMKCRAHTCSCVVFCVLIFIHVIMCVIVTA